MRESKVTFCLAFVDFYCLHHIPLLGINFDPCIYYLSFRDLSPMSKQAPLLLVVNNAILGLLTMSIFVMQSMISRLLLTKHVDSTTKELHFKNALPRDCAIHCLQLPKGLCMIRRLNITRMSPLQIQSMDLISRRRFNIEILLLESKFTCC